MSKDPKYTQCVACLENLHYKEQDDLYGATSDLGYCPNEACIRYGLLTLDAGELLADKVRGFTEKGSDEQE